MAGPVELLILLFVVFLILGPKRITNMFRALGRGVHNFTEQLGRNKEDKELPEEDKVPKRKD
ncbi:MAG: twin-arginine translocase TatA/TatE family subunit [Actinomycetota bacterium]|nr:twin-arginine translocase TatA/TatE family subunit [Actinomycetota bacterium]HZY64338.1 twin-arginine translocase TatA/TatE family subunit [Rubrobacteraceae bacterium]